MTRSERFLWRGYTFEQMKEWQEKREQIRNERPMTEAQKAFVIYDDELLCIKMLTEDTENHSEEISNIVDDCLSRPYKSDEVLDALEKIIETESWFALKAFVRELRTKGAVSDDIVGLSWR